MRLPLILICILFSSNPLQINGFLLTKNNNGPLSQLSYKQIPSDDIPPSIPKANDPATTTTPHSTTTTTATITHLIFPGGGVFFNWQGGVLSYLREQGYDLTKCTFSGSSAGSMTATFAATGVDFEEATRQALLLASNYKVWDRSDGLQGVLRPMIEEWLDKLLPDELPEALTRAETSRLSILVTPVPFLWQKEKLTSFANRQDLMACNLASIYLPFFSDGGFWYNIPNRGPYIDGNFLSTGKHYRPTNAKRSNTIFLNWQKDPVLADKGEDDLVATLTPDAVWGLVERGKEYAAIMEEKGRFKNIPKL